jgi:hypothetical protein
MPISAIDSYHQLGEVQVRQGRYRQAMDALQRALWVNVHDGDVRRGDAEGHAGELARSQAVPEWSVDPNAAARQGSSAEHRFRGRLAGIRGLSSRIHNGSLSFALRFDQCPLC